MYSGQIPIDYNDTSRNLFFMFAPMNQNETVDELVIWCV